MSTHEHSNHAPMMTAMPTTPDSLLTELLSGLLPDSAQIPAIPISDISLDSRCVQPGTLFLAVPGTKVDGVQFVQMALKNGAAAILHASPVDELVAKSAQQHRVPLLHDPQLVEHVGQIAARFYREPAKTMQMIGITGTDGKTSVSQFIAQSLSALTLPQRAACGVIGTLGNGIYGELQATAHTTPDAIRLQACLSELHSNAVEYVSMEVSSHGLQQRRVNGIDFDIAVLTNLGHDHLDYHRSIAAYQAAKQRLFAVPSLRAAVINGQDEFGVELIAKFATQYPITVYGIQDRLLPNANTAAAWVIGQNILYNDSGFSLTVVTPDEKLDIHCGLLGEFNVLNVLATIAALRCLGFDLKQQVPAIAKLTSPPGRMQMCRYPAQPIVVVDYAHTPQALQAALTAVRQHCSGRLFCVFGCGGDRDAAKRPVMGAIAEKHADSVIITDDNPRTESAAAIAEAILAGMQNPQHAQLIHDRQAAIAAAIDQAAAKDWILVAGKGHENTQLIGNQQRPFNDCSVVNTLLKQPQDGKPCTG